MLIGESGKLFDLISIEKCLMRDFLIRLTVKKTKKIIKKEEKNGLKIPKMATFLIKYLTVA